MMRKLLIYFLVSICSMSDSLGQTRDYFIGFTDRANSTYSLQQPLQFLSQRALDRRLRQNIPLSDNDLPVNVNYLSAVSATGALVVTPVKWFNGVIVRCDSSILSSVQALPFVNQSTPVKRTGSQKIRKDLDGLPPERIDHALLRAQSLDYGAGYRQIHQLNGDFLHNQGFAGQGMLIAAIDAGFNSLDTISAFDDLRSNNGIVATWDFVEGNASVYEDDAHGTSVLSCMGANTPGKLIGTAPQAAYMLLRSEDANSEYIVEEYFWAVAAAYADSAGADIITSSLGYSEFDDPSMNHTYAELDGHTCPAAIAGNAAASKGMLVLVSAGNSGSSLWHYILTPSDADSVLAVGAVDSSGYMASFSSWGPASDGDIKPNVAAMGRRTAIVYSDGSYTTGNGTSFSCPVLAGAAACLWQAHSSKSNMEVFHAIEESASYYTNPGDSLGYGIPDFYAAHLKLGGNELEMAEADNLLGVSPNPFNDQLTLQYYAATGHSLEVTLRDLTGRICYADNFMVQGGTTRALKTSLPASLPAGVYVVSAEHAGQQFVRKVVRIK